MRLKSGGVFQVIGGVGRDGEAGREAAHFGKKTLRRHEKT